MSRVALYCRLSEEDRNKVSADDDSASIQNQKSMLIQYATEQGWEIYGIYSDDDYTGADRSRPEFLAACHWRWAALMDTSFDVKGPLDPDVCL